MDKCNFPAICMVTWYVHGFIKSYVLQVLCLCLSSIKVHTLTRLSSIKVHTLTLGMFIADLQIVAGNKSVIFLFLLIFIFTKLLALLAQLNAHPTGDQEVAESIPAGLTKFFHGDWSWNIVYGHSLPSADSRRATVNFWPKNMHNTG